MSFFVIISALLSVVIPFRYSAEDMLDLFYLCRRFLNPITTTTANEWRVIVKLPIEGVQTWDKNSYLPLKNCCCWLQSREESAAPPSRGELERVTTHD